MNLILTKPAADWEAQLEIVVETMQEMSRQTDPQAMVRAYAARMQQLMPIGRRISLSRRDLSFPEYRITRSTTWDEDINPWLEKQRLPLLRGGLLAELIYNGVPRVFDDLEIAADEPAAEYLKGQRSLLAIPMYDQGESLNMVVVMSDRPAAFVKQQIPDLVLRSNLFGRATSNLVIKAELQRAYQALDRELKVVGEIQRSLLPAELPRIPHVDLAAFYLPSQRAGGDYYDFFPLPGGRWGIFIGDVSGHGTPAAVLMAVTHCIAHTHPGPAMPPGNVLAYLNHHLSARYTTQNGSFVTAFYGIYDPAQRTLTYACAGHPPPRVKRCQDGSVLTLNGVGGLPLGIGAEGGYEEHTQQLQTGDQIIFYTDGVTEAANPSGELFGTQRLDNVLANCSLQAASLLDDVLHSVRDFAAGRAIADDQTLIVMRIG